MVSILQSKNKELKIPKTLLLLSILILIVFVIFVVLHFSEAEKFAQLLSKAEPKWLLLAVVLQVGTYFCAGLIWNQVIRTAGQKVSISSLARLSVEKLSIDQLIPTGGVSGNLIVIETMKKLGLPGWLALESMLVDILSYYIAYISVTSVALLILWSYQEITNFICYLVGIFATIMLSIPITICWLLTNRNRQLPAWMFRFKYISNIAHMVKSVSPERILLPKSLGVSSFLNIAIFILDAGTLWTMIKITNYSAGIDTAFVAIVIASIAGAVSFLPGGIGGFEAGSVMVLSLLKIPVEVALTSTLLLRGFPLWIPLVPGILLARYDLVLTR